MGVYFTVAVRNLLQAKRRTTLLSMALAMVTMLLVLLLALSQGLTDTLIRSSTMLMTGHVNVGGFFKAKPSDSAPLITQTKEVRAIVEKATPNLDYVIDRHRGWAKLVSESRSIQVGVHGVDIAEEKVLLRELALAKESEYLPGGRDEVVGSLEGLAEPDTAVIFAAQASRLEVNVGDVLTVVAETLGGSNNTGEVRVVGVAKDVGFLSNWSLFTSKDVVRRLYQLSDDTSGAVFVYLNDIEDAESAMVTLTGALEEAGYPIMEHQPLPFFRKFETVSGEDWTGQRLDLTTWLDEVGQMKWTLDALQWVSFVLIGILVVIIVVGITNTMWMAVRERTGEIGTLRAIGMNRSRVVLMFMVEAALLGVVATGIGAACGGLLAGAVDALRWNVPIDAMRAILLSDTLHLVVEPGQLVWAVVVFTSITMLASLWPALRAAKLQPVTAMHHAG